jgi:hypothetical protein
MGVTMVDHSLMKLGKRSAKKDMRTLIFNKYTKTLVPAPASYELSNRITNLGSMGNDDVGDCTCAAIGHIVQAWTAELGKQIIPPDAAVIQLYTKFGYVPGDESTDQGAAELDVLNYIRKNGAFGIEFQSYSSIAPDTKQEIMDSVYYFGSAYIGLALPKTAQTQDVWDKPSMFSFGRGKPGSWGGHAVPIVDYNKTGPICITWGAFKQMTWAFMKEYCDEAYALLSPAQFAGGKSVEGFDLASLQTDLQAISS